MLLHWQVTAEIILQRVSFKDHLSFNFDFNSVRRQQFIFKLFPKQRPIVYVNYVSVVIVHRYITLANRTRHREYGTMTAVDCQSRIP